MSLMFFDLYFEEKKQRELIAILTCGKQLNGLKDCFTISCCDRYNI